MPLARPYFDPNHFKDWTHDQLVAALIKAKTELMEANANLSLAAEESERRGDGDPWYGTGQPMPYVPADGQW